MPTWKEIDRLVSEQRAAEALVAVRSVLEAARAAGRDEEWARALIREAQLGIALHSYEGAVRTLRERPWPDDELARSTVELAYAHTLLTYVEAYSWEIEQRERVETGGVVDLAQWTAAQVREEAERTLLAVWERRESIGAKPVAVLAEAVDPGTYPAGVRGTVRDALSTLLSSLLADSRGWSPAEEARVSRLPFGALLAERDLPAVGDRSAHPLARSVAVLADLEGWHRREGRPAAELEARLERARLLFDAVETDADRTLIVEDLERRLTGFRSEPWWAEGMATLAGLRMRLPVPDALILARAIAQRGWRAYPESDGGQRCRAIVAAIETPQLGVMSMLSDGAGQRSLAVRHANLERVFFRAWAVDLLERLGSASDYSLLPAGHEVERLMAASQPDAAWAVELPAAPDFRPHRTFVTPPLERPGLWVIVASAREDFGRQDNQPVATTLLVTDLVLLARRTDEGLEARALEARSGRPAAGAEVVLYRYDWRSGHRPLQRRTAGSDGRVVFPATGEDDRSGTFLLGRSNAHFALDPSHHWLSTAQEPDEDERSLVFTDRSVVRPGQTLYWKVLAYTGRADRGALRVLPGEEVEVTLEDANGEEVARKVVTTNAFGTAAGEFVVPAGRLLGEWSIETSLDGSTSVAVEEYKRPTFEVSLSEPESGARLNRTVRLAGEARYYFGLPVTGARVAWRVVRAPELPWWWWPPRPAAQEVVAAGEGSLSAEGTFAVEFTPAADERLGGEAGALVYRYRIEAEVTDEGGETRSAERAFRVGLVAVEARVETDEGFALAGRPAGLAILRTSLDGAPRAGEGRWRLLALVQPEHAVLPADEPVAEEPSPYATPGDRQRPRWERGAGPEAEMRRWPDGAELATGRVRHDAAGRGQIALGSLAPGAYRVRYETADEHGARFELAHELVVAGAGLELKVAGMLRLHTPTVAPGGTARLLVHSGLPQQTMLLEVFRDAKVVERRTLVSGRAPSLVELSVRAADRGNLTVALTLVRDHQLVTQRALIVVPWQDRKLAVSFSSFRDRLRPGAKETWTVKVEGAGAERGAAEVLAYMYDRSLELFAPHEPADPLSLYPVRTGMPELTASLGGGHAAPLRSSGFQRVGGPPQPSPARLKAIDRYGIGGPGRRGGVRTMAMAAPAPEGAPAEDAARDEAVFAEAVSISGGVEGGAGDDADERPSPALRTDFAETAFWRPHLVTGRDGTASLEFTVPDSVTSWRVWLHAITRDLKSGSLVREARSVKELMVRPYLPRFLREGDEAELSVVVNNASAAAMAGEITIEVREAETGADLAAEFGLAGRASARFEAPAGGGTTVSFPLRAPAGPRVAAVTVVARAGEESDGERRPLPVLPGRLHLVESRFATLREGDSRTLSFPDLERDDDPTRRTDRLVVTVDAQLAFSALAALPYLVEFPYECTEQTLNRFVSTALVADVFERHPALAVAAKQMAARQTRLQPFDAPDPNRRMLLEETPWLGVARGGEEDPARLIRLLDPAVARAHREGSLAALREAQTSSGGFPWFPGGPPSPYMTIYILNGLARAARAGVAPDETMAARAWAYLGLHFQQELSRRLEEGCCWELLTFLNFVASAYPAAVTEAAGLGAAERGRILEATYTHWREHSPYLKGMLALTLARAGRADDARRVWGSVLDSARTSEDLGTYWAAEERSWLWYNDTVETHAFALATTLELQPENPRIDGMVQWLLLNKKLNQWKSTRATAEAIRALVAALERHGPIAATEAVRVDVGRQTTTFRFDPERFTGARNQVVVEGEKVEPGTRVVVGKEGPGLAFASASWHFSTDRLPEEGRGDLFSVARRVYRRVPTAEGFVLRPLADGEALAVGDQLEVQLTLRAKHAAEYVHLRDPRGAGLEPESLRSGYGSELGVLWYEEVRDSGSSFFFERLPAGEVTLKVRLRAAMAGVFRVGPATVQSMYAPEFAAYSAGARLEVTPGRP